MGFGKSLKKFYKKAVGKNPDKVKTQEQQFYENQMLQEQQNKEMYGFGDLKDLVEARRKKQEQIEGYELGRQSNLSSLIGSRTTLG